MSAGEVRIRFTGPLDVDAAVTVLTSRGFAAATSRDRSEIEIDCRAGDEEAALSDVCHALDEWLLTRGLPFVPFRTEGTLIVRPPAA